MEALGKMVIAAFMMAALIVAGTVIYFKYSARRRLLISTTTSLHDTGLLDVIEREFEAKYPSIDLNFNPVGTGIAILNAEKGDVDMVLVHSPTLEITFLKRGYGVCRKIIAYNFFAIVGPETDPAVVNGTSPVEALRRIVEYGRTHSGRIWVSRGDNSGTHMKERDLWRMAGYNSTDLSREPWYADSGRGMGATLMMANEFSAYTLTDVGTYLKYYRDGRIGLVPLITRGEELLNVYSAIIVSKERFPHVNFEDALTFVKFLISQEGQRLIENYGKDEYGQTLFYGAVQVLEQNMPTKISEWIRNHAFFNGSECPPEYRGGHPELYS